MKLILAEAKREFGREIDELLRKEQNSTIRKRTRNACTNCVVSEL